MPFMSGGSTRAALIALGGLVVAGCGGDDDSLYTDAGTYNCAAETRDEEFVAGMEKTGTNGVTFTLVSSTPAPPSRGDNVWVIDLDEAGTPTVDATMAVTPFMPDHRHGTPIIPVVTPDTGTPGRYDVEPVNLWMPGLWEITVDATPQGGVKDTVVFRFCITG